jgi:hypothetical protein
MLLGAQGQRYVQLHVSKYSPLSCQEVFAMAVLLQRRGGAKVREVRER